MSIAQGTAESINQYLEEIDLVEANEGSYSSQLSDLLMSLGNSYQANSDFENANLVYQRGMQIEKINYGLFSLSQTPYLRAIAESHRAMNDWEQSQKAIDQYYLVNEKVYGQRDVRMLPVIESLINWHTESYNMRDPRNSFPNLTHSMFCGEQFPIHVAKAWRSAAPNSTIENLYGPTEGTIYITQYVFTLEDENKSFKNDIVPIGTPFDSHSSAIINESNKLIKDSKIGEIIFSGPQITNGYLDDKAKTDMSFTSFDWDSTSSIWYRTGDLGYRNSSGDIECIGRKDGQIKISGRRIEIGEIESALSRFKKTQGTIVVPLRDNQNIVIGCIGYTLDSLTKEEMLRIRRDITDFLDPVFFPKKIISVPQFPKSLSGKIDRKKLEIMAKDI